MKVLVVGRGGREHAIIWALRKSEKVTKLYCAPGNGGIAEFAECVALNENQFQELGEFAQRERIDLVIIGPDDPLFDGIVDHFESLQIPVFGPRKNAAIIEGSKVFTKDLLRKYNIPTAAYETFADYQQALDYLHQQSIPVVIKADGLAAGKGVTVAFTMDEAERALHDIMVSKVFGEAGNHVVIEEFLTGQEMSILAFVDGETVRAMVPSQDHKQVFDGDQGPNTGGMGTYSPVPHIDSALVEEAIETIIKPTAKAMVAEGRPFRGVLFAGLMMTPNGPKTIEFNARFGDPETQVVLPRLKTDLLDIFLAVVHGGLADLQIEWGDEAAVCVIAASGGYPGSFNKGYEITGLDELEGVYVFHAGTKISEENGGLLTNGGRVLGVTALGSDIAAARAKAYAEIAKVQFTGKHSRTDIAAKALVK
jgi:phosphoribosylamine--glycine ligase